MNETNTGSLAPTVIIPNEHRAVPYAEPVVESTPTYIGAAEPLSRIAELKRLAAGVGIRLPDTRVPEGDSLLPIGTEAARKLACEIDALPSVADGLDALRTRITQEAAVDTKVSLQGIRAETHRCALVPPNGPSLGYTESGFGHFLSFIKPDSVRGGFGSTLLALPPPIRADAVNYFASTSRNLPDGAVVRTIIDPGSGRRVIRAITSPKHSLATGDDGAIADAVQSAIPAGAKLRITRSLDRTDLEVIWPAMARELRVGDAALFSVGVVNSETKAGSLRVEPRILRVLCYNFTTAYSEGADEEIAIRHVGDLRTKLPAAFAKALRVIEPFVVRFADAYKDALPAFAPTRGEILARAGSKLELGEGLLTRATALWDADGAKSAGDTLAGLVNALTRASQEQTISAGIETERAAGKLIHQGWAALA